MLDEFNPKLNKICVDIRSKSYNRSMKSWLQDNDKIDKYMTSVSRNGHIDKLR